MSSGVDPPDLAGLAIAPVIPEAGESAEPPAAAKPNVRRALGWSVRASLVVQVIGSISGIELARGLGLHNRGALAAAMLWPMVAGTLGALGIEESTTYHVAREPENTGRLIGSGLMLCALQSAVFGLITLAIVPVVLSGKGSGVVVSALIFSLYVPLNMFAVMLNAVLNGLHRYEWCNIARILVGLAIVISQSVLLAIGAMSVRSLVIVFQVCYVASLIWIASLVWRTKPGRVSWDRATVHRLFSYGIRSHASTIPSQLNQNLDQLLISIFLTTTQLGIYVVAVTMTSLTALFGGSVAYAALPNVAGLGEGPERAILARRLVSLTIVISTVISLGIIALTPQLIHLFFGAPFVRGSGVARILLVAAVALSTNRAIEGVLRGIGRPLDAGIAEIVALGATVVSLAVLLPTLGLTGAALSSVVAYLVAMVWMTRRTTRAMDITPRQLLTPDHDALAALAGRLRAIRGA